MPINEKYLANFEQGCFYHVYNRSVSNRLLFKEEKNYTYFLTLLKEYIAGIADIYAYSLLPNHFHLLISVKEIHDSNINKRLSNQFRSLFIAYTNAVNKVYEETGGIFQTPFRRIKIDNDTYFTQLVYYIHYNSVHHNISKDISNHKWSSYHSIISNLPTLLKRDKVIEWFGDRDNFTRYHQIQKSNFTSDIFIE